MTRDKETLYEANMKPDTKARQGNVRRDKPWPVALFSIATNKHEQTTN